MRILVLDNYDSFTYNLVHYFKELGYGDAMSVFRNDAIHLDDVDQYEAILLSPGPGIPNEAGIMPQLIEQYGPSKRILGVCLGHQAIGQAYGAEIFNMETVMHGVTSQVQVKTPDRLFNNLPDSYGICHYHSWSIDPDNLGNQLEVIAIDEIGQIMAVRHKEYDVRGVQFHPESIMTEHGHELLRNWIEG